MADKINKVIRKLTNPIMEKLMTCNIVNAQTCPVEKQKFHLLTSSWAQEYPKFAWYGDSLTGYYDTLITASHSVNPPLKFVQSYLKTMKDTVYVNNLNIESSYQLKGSQIKANLLSSPNIVIECMWSKKSLDISDNNYYISWMNFTFKSSNGASVQYFINMTIYNMTLDPSQQRQLEPTEPADFNLWLDQNKENYDLYGNLNKIFSNKKTLLIIFY